MEIAFLSLLPVMREVYQQPRGMKRFREYIAAATGGQDDVALPIMTFNPMAREHVIAKLDMLIAQDTEGIAQRAIEEAQQRLVAVPGELKVGVELADDLMGGWTNRYLTDARKFADRVDLKRPFATAVLWVSEDYTPEQIGQLVQAAIYRAAYRSVHGPTQTLNDMLAQERAVAAFAGIAPELDPAALAAVADLLAPLRESSDYPTQFAAIYGDPPATMAGYPALGLPLMAGFQLAAAEAAQVADPVALLV